MTTSATPPVLDTPARFDLVRHAVRALLLRYNLNRDWIIGFIGMRGSGKSLGGANVTVRDFAMDGMPMASNMKIKAGIKIDDDLADYYNVEPGIETYEAIDVDRDILFSLDSRYDGHVIFLDEPNMEYSEARRAISTTNLRTADVVQQLRKGETALVYAVINEMYVDPRVRDNTDIMIKCSDVALNPRNLRAHMQQGVLFEWEIYGWSPKYAGNGNTFTETRRPMEKVPVKMENIWNMIDTRERQLRDDYNVDSKSLMPIELRDSPGVAKSKADPVQIELEKRMGKFWENHASDGEFIEIFSTDIAQELGIEKYDWGRVFKKYLDGKLIVDYERRYPRNKTKYVIKNRELV